MSELQTMKVEIKGDLADKVRRLANENETSNNEIVRKLVAIAINLPLKIERKELRITICEE